MNSAKITEIAHQLTAVAKNLLILKRVAWPVSLRETFFRHKAEKIPTPEYEPFDASQIFQALETIEAQLDDHPTAQWLKEKVRIIYLSAQMLAHRDSPDFYHYGKQLYGTPSDHLIDGKNTVLDLARQLDTSLDYYNQQTQKQSIESKTYNASEAAHIIRQRIQHKFGDDAPKILITNNLSARATASTRKIRLHQEATFNEKFINQLIQHEAYIHVVTSRNGAAQTQFPFLRISHPGTTKTQEGLAVFAEFITGTMNLERMNRLADRVLAIQMAVEGANFIDIYRYFLERHENDTITAYENTRRVFRGGVTTGGAPFTKDIVYLDGLIRVHNFLRAMVNVKRIDVLPYLFSGKLALEDIPMICELAKEGICQTPKYMPDWAQDNDFLLCYLAYSSFLNQIDMRKVSDHYTALLSNVCDVEPN